MNARRLTVALVLALGCLVIAAPSASAQDFYYGTGTITAVETNSGGGNIVGYVTVAFPATDTRPAHSVIWVVTVDTTIFYFDHWTTWDSVQVGLTASVRSANDNRSRKVEFLLLNPYIPD